MYTTLLLFLGKCERQREMVGRRRQTDGRTDRRERDGRERDRQTDRDKRVIMQQLCQCRPLRELSPVCLSTSYNNNNGNL